MILLGTIQCPLWDHTTSVFALLSLSVQAFLGDAQFVYQQHAAPAPGSPLLLDTDRCYKVQGCIGTYLHTDTSATKKKNIKFLEKKMFFLSTFLVFFLDTKTQNIIMSSVQRPFPL